MSRWASRPAGPALGALAGQFPFPALGCVPSAGVGFYDEFLTTAGSVVASRYGDRFWTSTTIGGAPTYSSQNPAANSEAGILQAVTTSVANAGAVLTLGTVAPFYRHPPAGSIFAVKVNLTSGTTNYNLWAGFASAAATVAVADATQFLGIRSVGANLFGVLKDGAAAGNESTVDLGVDCEAAWVIAGFEVRAGPSIQFFTMTSPSDLHTWDATYVGSPQTTNYPTSVCFPVLGCVTLSTTPKTVQWDFVGLGGKTGR